jgi:hypothetical protein
MNFKISELSAFSSAKLGTSDNAIANVSDNGDRIVQKNTYYGKVGWIFRRSGAKAANNAVRTELLCALGRAFDLEGVGNNSAGKTTFSRKFMDRLSELLGPEFKRDDFGIGDDGIVDSGRPLTQRRIKAILNRATLVGRAKNEDFDIKAAQVKYDYVSSKIKSLPEDSRIREHFDSVKKLMDFVQNELPTLLTGNYMFDRNKPVDELNPAGYLQKIDEDGNPSISPLLKIDNVRAYLVDRLGEHFHIPENIVPGKHTLIDDLDDPVGQITTYVGNVCKSFITASLDLYIDAEAKGKLDKFSNALYGVCLEAKTESLMNFKFTHLPDEGEAVALHDKTMSLEKCMGREIELLIADEEDDDKKTWANVAARVKEKLVGVVRPICTAEVERDDEGDITKVTYRPVLDINDHPVVREITEQDLDEIGEAVMATIIEGA